MVPESNNYTFSRAKYTEFIAANVENKAVRESLFELLNFAAENAYKIKRGQGEWNLHYIIQAYNGSSMLFSWNTSSVEVRLGNFPFVDNDVKNCFVEKLTSSSDGFNYLERLIEDGKTVESFSIIETIVDPNIMRVFQEAVLYFQKHACNISHFFK